MSGLLWIAAEIEQDRRKKDDFESSKCRRHTPAYAMACALRYSKLLRWGHLRWTQWTRSLDTKGGCDSVGPFGGNAALAFQSDYCARGVAFEEGRD